MRKKYSIKTELETSPDSGSQKPKLSRVRINFDNHEFSIDLSREIEINENNLIDSMIEHASNYAWWAAVTSSIKRKLREKKRELDAKANSLDEETRDYLKDNGIKVTETGVKAAIKSDPRYKSLQSELAPLEDIAEFFDLMLRALENKRDMLKEINRAQCGERFNQ